MQLYVGPALIVLLEILTTAVSAASEGSGEDQQGLFACDKLPDAEFKYIAEPKDSVTPLCLKKCPTDDSYLWYHGFTTTDTLTMIHQGGNLTVDVPSPPRYNDLGYFCCACAGEHSLDSCCVGVALKPQVVRFTVTQDGQAVTGVYVGSKVTLSCEAYAYPSLTLNILKDGKNITGMKPDDESWYSCTKSMELLSVTEEDSGTYVCNAAITLRQNGEPLPLNSQQLRELVVYRQLKVDTWQKGSADENLTVVCSVSSSIPDYTVTWLFNNEPVPVDGTNTVETRVGLQHQLTLRTVTRDNQGIYTCVVSTPYHGEEDRGSVEFKVIDFDPRPGSQGGRPQPHGTDGNGGGLFTPVRIIIFLAVVAVCTVVAVVAVIVLFGKSTWTRLRGRRGKVTLLPEDSEVPYKKMEGTEASEGPAEPGTYELQAPTGQSEESDKEDTDGVQREAQEPKEVVILKGRLRHRRQ